MTKCSTELATTGIYLCVYVYVCVCIYTYMYIYTHIYVCRGVCVHVCIVCECIYSVMISITLNWLIHILWLIISLSSFLRACIIYGLSIVKYFLKLMSFLLFFFRIYVKKISCWLFGQHGFVLWSIYLIHDPALLFRYLIMYFT